MDISTLSITSSRTRSAVWEHARPALDCELIKDGRSLIWYGKYCPDYSARSTTTAKNHLRSKHPENAIVRVEAAAGLEVDRQELIQAIVKCIVRYDLPFRLVEWPEFHRILEIANLTLTKDNGLVVSHHSSVSKAMNQLYD
ncbi:hypothetical protein B0T26DRAFT_303865 [Lasiosphaeria miniovina]|uniref:Uncharacterized protein n=1 Tax=Lasiosphaeria miniovina TaxID=1954250 RepID=A0AA40AL06_9PEZI|nr:uncharacterized protein B0T26DRAFT_303865 [Lasiosphaeria miniovina]KAK0717793.1 hypothetical protein B0T26DRAFT_303865 [Lasiosphaeria miniovina]